MTKKNKLHSVELAPAIPLQVHTAENHAINPFQHNNKADAIYKRLTSQRYTYRVLQTIQLKLIILCVWAEQAVLDSVKTALKFKYKI